MCNNKTKTKVGFTVDDYLNYEGLIVCPQCHGNIFTCDIEESELQKLCEGKYTVIECPHCMADYSVDMNLKVEIVRWCRNCDDVGVIAFDSFELINGHYTTVRSCECCGGE